MAPVRMRGSGACVDAAHLVENAALVDGPPDLVAAQRGDHALDLPPVAETRDIAVVTAALRTGRGFEASVVAEALDQLRRVGQRRPPIDEEGVHRPRNSTRAFRDCRQMSSTAR